MRRLVGLWFILAAAAFFLIPWQLQEEGFFAFEWLAAYPDERTASGFFYAISDRPWLWAVKASG